MVCLIPFLPPTPRLLCLGNRVRGLDTRFWRGLEQFLWEGAPGTGTRPYPWNHYVQRLSSPFLSCRSLDHIQPPCLVRWGRSFGLYSFRYYFFLASSNSQPGLSLTLVSYSICFSLGFGFFVIAKLIVALDVFVDFINILPSVRLTLGCKVTFRTSETCVLLPRLGAVVMGASPNWKCDK